MKNKKIIKAAAALMDAMKPHTGYKESQPVIVGFNTVNIQEPLINLMVALKRIEDPKNSFLGNGIYLAGKYGITVTDDPEDCKEPESEEEENDDRFDYLGHEGTYVSINQLGEDDLYEVTVVAESEKPFTQFDMTSLDLGRIYYGSSHSIWGSGDTKMVLKFK